jgi:hypothetical protein
MDSEVVQLRRKVEALEAENADLAWRLETGEGPVLVAKSSLSHSSSSDPYIMKNRSRHTSSVDIGASEVESGQHLQTPQSYYNTYGSRSGSSDGDGESERGDRTRSYSSISNVGHSFSHYSIGSASARGRKHSNSDGGEMTDDTDLNMIPSIQAVYTSFPPRTQVSSSSIHSTSSLKRLSNLNLSIQSPATLNVKITDIKQDNFNFVEISSFGVARSILSGIKKLEVSRRQPGELLDRFPASVSPAIDHLVEFSFPEGVQLELMTTTQALALIGKHNDKYHILQFSDASATPLYACCLTITEAFPPPNREIVDHLIDLQYKRCNLAIIVTFLRLVLRQKYDDPQVFMEKKEAWKSQNINFKKNTASSSHNPRKFSDLTTPIKTEEAITTSNVHDENGGRSTFSSYFNLGRLGRSISRSLVKETMMTNGGGRDKRGPAELDAIRIVSENAPSTPLETGSSTSISSPEQRSNQSTTTNSNNTLDITTRSWDSGSDVSETSSISEMPSEEGSDGNKIDELRMRSKSGTDIDIDIDIDTNTKDRIGMKMGWNEANGIHSGSGIECGMRQLGQGEVSMNDDKASHKYNDLVAVLSTQEKHELAHMSDDDIDADMGNSSGNHNVPNKALTTTMTNTNESSSLLNEKMAVTSKSKSDEMIYSAGLIVTQRCFVALTRRKNHTQLFPILDALADKERSVVQLDGTIQMSKGANYPVNPHQESDVAELRVNLGCDVAFRARTARRHKFLQAFRECALYNNEDRNKNRQNSKIKNKTYDIDITNKNRISDGMNYKFKFPLYISRSILFHTAIPSLDNIVDRILFSAVPSPVLVKLHHLLLMEQSVLVCGLDPGLVSVVVTAVARLVEPFTWEGIMIPLLPNSNDNREIFHAPVPFVVGVAASDESLLPKIDCDIPPSVSVLCLRWDKEGLKTGSGLNAQLEQVGASPLTSPYIEYSLLSDLVDLERELMALERDRSEQERKTVSMSLHRFMGPIVGQRSMAIAAVARRMKHRIFEYNRLLMGDINSKDAWQKYGIHNQQTGNFEFYPEMFMEPKRGFLDFQENVVHTQLFVSYVDSLRTKYLCAQDARIFIATWLWYRLVKRNKDLNKKQKDMHNVT